MRIPRKLCWASSHAAAIVALALATGACARQEPGEDRCGRLPWGDAYEQRIDVPTDRALIDPTLAQPEDAIAAAYREIEASIAAGGTPDLARHFYTAFRYRDAALLPLYRRLIEERSTRNPLHVLWSIAIVGELGQAEDFQRVARLVGDADPIVREYAASALGKLGRRADLPFLRRRLEEEPNSYVRATMGASAVRIRTGQPRPLSPPVYERGGLRKLKYFLNGGVAGGGLVQAASAEAADVPLASSFVFPHQQYAHPVAGAPGLPSFGGVYDHVGEDSGWFLQGLPVHSIAEGVVCRRFYDRSWGNVVVVASRTEDEHLTIIYGHLSHDVDVHPGERVALGQKIGEIGPAASLENGGYWPHLHLGIERSSCEEARVAGFDPSTWRYHDALSFVDSRLLGRDQAGEPRGEGWLVLAPESSTCRAPAAAE